jgi:hypothetical protein
MRCAHPAKSYRNARIVRADKGDLLARGIKEPQCQEQVGIGCLRCHPQFSSDGAGDLEAVFERRRAESQTVAGCVIAQACGARRVLRLQPQSIRLQEISGPPCARERPFVFSAHHEFLTRVTNVQRYAGLLHPAGILAFEEIAEEFFLQRLAILAVEVREVCVAVHFEPLLSGSCS